MSPKHLLALIVALPMFLAAASHGQLTWEAQTIQVKAKPDAKQVTAAFKFRNETDYSLTIRAVRGPKDCRINRPGKRTYRPGEGDTLQVTYPIAAERGKLTRTIAVFSDSTREPRQELTLKLDLSDVPIPEPAKPRPILKVDRSMLMWRVGESMAPKTLNIEILQKSPVAIAGIKPMIRPAPRMKAKKQAIPTPLTQAFIADVKAIEEGRRYRVTITPTQTGTGQSAMWQLVDAEGKRVRATPTIRSVVVDIKAMRKRMEAAKKKRQATPALPVPAAKP